MRVVLGGSPGRHPRPSALRAIHQTFGTVSQVSVSLTDPCLLPGRWYVDGGGWTNCESAPLDQHGRPSVRHIVLARGHQRFGGLGALGGLQVGATVSAGAGPRVGRGGGDFCFRQAELLLLRAGLGACKAQHLWRCTPPAVGHGGALFDGDLHGALRCITVKGGRFQASSKRDSRPPVAYGRSGGCPFGQYRREQEDVTFPGEQEGRKEDFHARPAPEAEASQALKRESSLERKTEG